MIQVVCFMCCSPSHISNHEIQMFGTHLDRRMIPVLTLCMAEVTYDMDSGVCVCTSRQGSV